MIQRRKVTRVIELHEKEIALILALRHKFKYGDVTIIMRDGIPQRIQQAIIFDDLKGELSISSKLSTNSLDVPQQDEV